MKLKDCRETYREMSGQASEIARKLGFSGIALIWVFKTGSEAMPTLPSDLLLPAFFIILSLGLDLLQYVSAALFWGSFARISELRGISNEQDFKAPRFLNWGALAAFWLKLISIAVAYWFLLDYAVTRFK